MADSAAAATQMVEPKTITINVAMTEAYREPLQEIHKLASPIKFAGLSADWGSKYDLRILLLGPEAAPEEVPNPPAINIEVYIDGQLRRDEGDSDPHSYRLRHAVTVTSVTSEFVAGTLRLNLITHS